MSQLSNSKPVRRFARDPLPVGGDALPATVSDGRFRVSVMMPVPDDGAGTDNTPSLTPSKAAMVLGLLTREEGARINELTAATGWLPHTMRAALTGLRKKGHVVVREKVDGVTRYAIKSLISE